MTQVVDMVLDKIVDHLTLVMQTNIDPTDVTYADIVKKGLLQENKAKRNIGIGVTGGDHDDPEYTDGVVSLSKMPEIAMDLPVREIGGGQMWWRRGVIRVECFFIREKLEEDEAFIAAYDVLGRVQANIENIDLTGTVDDYGERAIRLFCFGNTFFESGGAPKSFIFRGKVFWLCLTERP
jgi:hypothetical protein